MNEKIRVCQVMGEWFGGGVESVVMNYYRHMNRENVQFDFVCLENSTNIPYEEIQQLGGRVFLVPHYKKWTKYKRAFQKILQENHYQIVHANLNALSVLPLHVAKKENVPIRIAHSHSTSHKKEVLRHFVKNVLRVFSKVNANAFFACSDSAGKWLFGKKALEHGDIFVLKNAIDYEAFVYQEEYRKKHREAIHVGDDTVLYGAVGRLVTQKNPEFILHLFQEIHKIQKCKLVFIGQGPLQSKLQEKAKELQIGDDIIFVGQRTDVNEWYSALDMLLFPSLYEGFGMVAVEAQVAGLPVICSTEVPKETKISSWISYMDLHEDITKWREQIISLQNSFQENDRTVLEVENTFDISNEAKKLEEKYRELLSSVK